MTGDACLIAVEVDRRIIPPGHAFAVPGGVFRWPNNVSLISANIFDLFSMYCTDLTDKSLCL